MYQFTEDCLTGITAIDEEHRQLFATINEAFALLQEQEPVAALAGAKNLVVTLKKYAATHFEHEEKHMRETNDPELPRQVREHAVFTEKVNGVDMDALNEENGRKVLEELLEYLSRWLYHHIIGSDTLIGKLGRLEESADPFAFTEEYRTGIGFVDEEHTRLFEIIRDTNDVIHAELLHDKYDEIVHILDELKDYTIMHFQDEEAYMERIGYAGLTAQRNAHQAFVDKLNEIDLGEVDDNQQAYLDELIEFLLGWLVNHILKVDKKIPVEA